MTRARGRNFYDKKNLTQFAYVVSLHDLHHKSNIRQSNNQNCVKFVHSYVHTFYTQISCFENMFDTSINVLIDEIQTYERMNVTQISHLLINMCVNCVFNA